MKQSLSQHIEDYLSECRNRGLSQNTLKAYTSSLVKFEAWAGARQLQETPQVTRAVLREYVSDLAQTLQPGGAHARLRVMRSFFRWLLAEEEIARNPMERVALPKLPRKILPAVGAMEVKKLFEAAQKSRFPLRDAAILGTLFDCGLRVSELCGLKLSDVIAAGRIEVQEAKGGKSRVVPISRTALRLIRRYVENERPKSEEFAELFLSLNGAMNRDGVKQLLERLCKSAGLPIFSPHTFRRGFAVAFLRGGGDVFTLQRIMGHSTLEMSNRYAVLQGDDLKNVHRIASPMENLKR